MFFSKLTGSDLKKTKKLIFRTRAKSMKVKIFGFSKILMVLFFFGLAISGLKAQTMYVRPNTGAQSSYAIANIKNLTFSGGNLVVTNLTGANGTFPLSGNRYLNFTNLTLATAVVNLCKGTTPTPLTNPSGSALKWYTVTGTTAAPIYTLIAAGAPSPLTTTVASPSKVYAVSEMLSNGLESAKFEITVNVLALPTEVLGAITSNTESSVTPGTYLAATKAVGQFVGTQNTVTYRVPAFVGADLTYVWTVPSGVNIVSQNANTVTVNFLNVLAGVGAIGNITVQAQNASGCRTAAKTLALTKVLPAAPAAIKMTDASLPIPSTGIPKAVTSFAKYMGTDRVVTLTATPSTTATSYVWELPTGVNLLSGATTTSGVISGTSNVITVNFLGVTAATLGTDSYTTTAGVLTYVLRIGVKSKNGVGVSFTNNTALINPQTPSTDKLLTLTAIAPAAPAAITMTNPATPVVAPAKPVAITAVSKFIGTETPFTLTATPSVLASSYTWELPFGVNLVSGNLTGSSSNVITVNFNNVPAASPNIYIGVKAVNGISSSVTTNVSPAPLTEFKYLKLTAAVPAAVSAVAGQVAGVCGSSSYNYTITPSPLATSYDITAPTGSVVTSAINSGNLIETLNTTDLTFTVTYPAGFATVGAPKSLAVAARNGVGASANKTLTLSTLMPAIATVAGGTSFQRTTPIVFSASVLGGVTYTWVAANGAVITNGQGTNSVTVDFSAVSSTVTSTKLTVYATNACGLNTAVKSATLASTSSGARVRQDVIAANAGTVEVSIYPNPAKEYFNIELNAATKGQMEITIISLNGAIISSRNIQLSKGNNVINENVSSLTTGIYFVKLTNSSSNETSIKKLIKE
jgi:hypothetical protein